MSELTVPGEYYSIDAEASNAGIPYADSFLVSNHWCLTRETHTETRLVVWTSVKYKKSMWGFMKGASCTADIPLAAVLVDLTYLLQLLNFLFYSLLPITAKLLLFYRLVIKWYIYNCYNMMFHFVIYQCA